MKLPPLLEQLDDTQRRDVDNKIDTLHSHWIRVRQWLEARVELADSYVRVHEASAELEDLWDNLDEKLSHPSPSSSISDDLLAYVERIWLEAQQIRDRLGHRAEKFIHDAQNQVIIHQFFFFFLI